MRSRAVSAADGVSQSKGWASACSEVIVRMRAAVSSWSTSGELKAAASEAYVMSSWVLVAC